MGLKLELQIAMWNNPTVTGSFKLASTKDSALKTQNRFLRAAGDDSISKDRIAHEIILPTTEMHQVPRDSHRRLKSAYVNRSTKGCLLV